MELHRQKNVATYIYFPLVDANGALVTGSANPDSEMDAWNDSSAPDGFADLTNEATEIGATGWYYISLTQGEMNYDYIAIQVKSDNALTQMILINTKPFTEVDAIYDKLPANNIADQTLIDTDLTSIEGKIDTVDGIVDAILVDTDTMEADLKTYMDTIEDNIRGADNDSIKNISDEIAGLTIPTVGEISDGVWDEVLTGATHNVASSAGRRLRNLGDTISGSVNDAGATTTEFDTTLTGYGDNQFNQQLMRFTSGNLEGQVRVISDYTSATGEFCFCTGEPWTEAPTNADEFDIIPNHVHTIDDYTTIMQGVIETNDLDHLAKIAHPTGDPVADSLFDLIMNKDAGQTFDRAADSLEAIRDRGDASWITGGGGGITDIVQVVPSIPALIDLANTKTVRLALYLINSLDDLPTTVEMTVGTITIDRSGDGGTSWTNIVNAGACSEHAGCIYYDEVFDSGTGYVAGDMIRITFKGQKITVAANDYEITDPTDGMIFYTNIQNDISSLPTSLLNTDLASYTTANSLADLLKRGVGLLRHNQVIEFDWDGDNNNDGGTIYLYDTKANALVHDKITGLIGEYEMEAVFNANNKPTKATVTKES